MNKEIWKDIPDFPGYQASNIGRIKSTSRTIYVNNGKRSYSYTIPEKIMRLTVRKQYLCVTFNFYKEWNSMNAAARYYNIAAASIKSACDRGHKCCKYYWKYSE